MQLTNNFRLKEFKCKNGVEVPANLMSNIQELACNLQLLRNEINRPIHINSAYRTELYNAKIGGVRTSKHLLGMASDISIKGIEPKKIYDIIEVLIDKGVMKDGGLGLYDNFVHYDIRGYNARWNYSNS